MFLLASLFPLFAFDCFTHFDCLFYFHMCFQHCFGLFLLYATFPRSFITSSARSSSREAESSSSSSHISPFIGIRLNQNLSLTYFRTTVACAHSAFSDFFVVLNSPLTNFPCGAPTRTALTATSPHNNTNPRDLRRQLFSPIFSFIFFLFFSKLFFRQSLSFYFQSVFGELHLAKLKNIIRSY